MEPKILSKKQYGYGWNNSDVLEVTAYENTNDIFFIWKSGYESAEEFYRCIAFSREEIKEILAQVKEFVDFDV